MLSKPTESVRLFKICRKNFKNISHNNSVNKFNGIVILSPQGN